MTITYEPVTSISGQDFIRRNNEDGSFSDIPKDPANSDYQEYLKSLDEASTL
jgi:hypothetical protein